MSTKMNCKKCIGIMKAHPGGQIPSDATETFRAHLESCPECTSLFEAIQKAYKAMDEEKMAEFNPFIATRIMAQIEELDTNNTKVKVPVWMQVLRPVLVAASLLLAVWLGTEVGSAYKSDKIVQSDMQELASLNDVVIESLDWYNE
jgi:anti-sigma factor RsiW